LNDKTFNIPLKDSELTLIICQLWQMEKTQLEEARRAEHHGRSSEAKARRQTARAALELSEKLSRIGAELS